LKIRAPEQRLRLELIRKYGPKIEPLSDAQLLLLDLEPGVSNRGSRTRATPPEVIGDEPGNTD
jgi:hypothetical protein